MFLGGTIRTLVLLFFFAAFQPGGADPRIGSWTLVSAQSSLTPPNQLSITPVQGGTHVVMSGQTHLDFTAGGNGHQSSAPGNLGFNQIALRRINKRQAEVKEEQDGSVVATIREAISPDGNELTSTTSMPNQPSQVTVWTRTGGQKQNKDLFAGEWTEDLSKTRMQQGMVLKIEGDGSGGVHFQGDYSYTGHLDGKQYDLQHSRNDTVALQLADPHTVDEVYRRGDQITQRDRWQVSPNGQQMTLSTTGVLETGQHITEKLTFKKQ
jgi:hypothetical protein